jgi:hypothetical protein
MINPKTYLQLPKNFDVVIVEKQKHCRHEYDRQHYISGDQPGVQNAMTAIWAAHRLMANAISAVPTILLAAHQTSS